MEIRASELVHNWRAFGIDAAHDPNISTAAALSWFPNLWQGQVAHGPTAQPGWGPSNEAEDELMGFRPFAVPDVPTWKEAADRIVYAAGNMYRRDMGNPQFGSVSTVFSPAYVRNASLINPVDTGRWESSCNLSHPAHPHGAHGAAARHVFNCSAWAAGYDKPGWTRPPLGTFEDFFHLVLPNLEFSLRANAMIAQPPAGSGINCSGTAGGTFDCGQAADALSVLFGRWFPHPDGSQRQNVSGGLFYLEVDVAATPIYPRGVKMHVALFQTLFGSALGRRLQAWCIQRGWALVWALGPPGGAGFPDPHDPAFALEDQRIVDATVATKIANLHPRAVVDAANLAPFEALWERVSKLRPAPPSVVFNCSQAKTNATCSQPPFSSPEQCHWGGGRHHPSPPTSPAAPCGAATHGHEVAIGGCANHGSISKVLFASYGMPTGACAKGGGSTFRRDASCDDKLAAAAVEELCVGKASCVLSTDSFANDPDPCPGKPKRLAVQVACAAAGRGRGSKRDEILRPLRRRNLRQHPLPPFPPPPARCQRDLVRYPAVANSSALWAELRAAVPALALGVLGGHYENLTALSDAQLNRCIGWAPPSAGQRQQLVCYTDHGEAGAASNSAHVERHNLKLDDDGLARKRRAAPPANGVMNFDGFSTYYDIKELRVRWSYEADIVFAVDLWLYHEDPTLDSNRVLDFGNGVPSDNIAVMFAGTSGTMRYEVYRGTSGRQLIETSKVFPAKSWTRVTVIHTASKQATIYWNGVLKISGVMHAPKQVTRNNNYIGKSNWSSDKLFKGRMKDFRIWNKAVTLAQITAVSASVAPIISVGSTCGNRCPPATGEMSFDGAKDSYFDTGVTNLIKDAHQNVFADDVWVWNSDPHLTSNCSYDNVTIGSVLRLKTDEALTVDRSKLRDPPIDGASRLYLDGQWIATGLIRTFPAAKKCFNRSADWLKTASGFTPDWPTNAGGLCGECAFAENTDYGTTSSGVTASKVAYSITPQQCCEMVGADPLAAAAVWHKGANPWTGSGVGDCVFKSAADVAHKVARAHYTAIVPAKRSAWQRISIKATVPGDLVTDLQLAGVIDDPLFGTNFKNASVWNVDFNYTTTFARPAGSEQLLIFDGIKMGARISLNGQHLGNASDQHRRYVFSVSQLLESTNTLTVAFDSSIDMSAGRFMSCSGGWDWAPYSNTRDPGSGLPVFTKGVWKSVYLVGLAPSSAAIASLVPLVRYTGKAWPTTAMADDGSAPFEVAARVFFRAEQPVSGTLTLTGGWGGKATQQVSLEAGETPVNITVAAEGVKLWWARGMGRTSTMYNVSATFMPAGGAEQSMTTVSATRRIGFRHLVLVTVNDTDPKEVHAACLQEGNWNHTLMLRLNGAPVSGLGSNMVPMEEIEGRYTPGMHRQIVRSAADAGMSLLRVWGGGIYPYEEWMNACDEFGVLSIVDMMYGTDGQMPDPKATAEQEQEFRDNVRRMAHHPSLAVYTGCNECMGLGMPILDDFVLRTVASEDDSRPIRDASPFTGYCTGVDRLTGFPNGRNLTTKYWPSCIAPPPPPAPCLAIKNQSACDPERCTWAKNPPPAHCENPPPPPPPTPTAQCAFEAGIDYGGGSIGTFASASPAACCALCKTKSTCEVGVWVGPPGHCYLKSNSSTGYKRPGGGRYSCKPNKTAAPDYDAGQAKPLHHGEEQHGPYNGGGGWPAINGHAGPPAGPKLMIQVPTDLTHLGPACSGYMRTETGCTATSSFESMSVMLPPEQWGIEGEGMHERNYPCHTHIFSYFGNLSLSGIGAAAFQQQLYLCQLAQGFERKANIEAWRSSNVWALLMWQLNEIWPTGGWGSLEYGTPVKGQVIGGRWKILHSFMRQATFTDVFVGCGMAANNPSASAQPAGNGSSISKAHPLCYLRNGLPDPFTGTVAVALVSFATGQVSALSKMRVTVGAGDAGSSQLFCPNGTALLGASVPITSRCGTFDELLQSAGCEATSCYLDVRADVHAADAVGAAGVGAALYGHNQQLLAAPFHLQLPPLKLTVTAAAKASSDGSVTVSLAADRGGVAAYVWLSTLAAGRFEPNGFMMPTRAMTVKFMPFGAQPADVATLQASVRVDHLRAALEGLRFKADDEELIGRQGPGASAPLACQPNAERPMLPIFHFIGNVSKDSSGPVEVEQINDVSGISYHEGLWHV